MDDKEKFFAALESQMPPGQLHNTVPDDVYADDRFKGFLSQMVLVHLTVQLTGGYSHTEALGNSFTHMLYFGVHIGRQLALAESMEEMLKEV